MLLYIESKILSSFNFVSFIGCEKACKQSQSAVQSISEIRYQAATKLPPTIITATSLRSAAT